MANSSILAIPLLSAGQAAKENTINQAISFLEKATNDNQTLNFASGDIALPLLDLQRYFIFRATNVAAPRNLTVPAATRVFAIDNTAGADTITVVRGSNNVILAAGTAGVMYVDAGNIMFLWYSDNGGTINFTALGDVPSAYSGEAGKFLRVTATEDGIEFAAAGAGVSDFTDLNDVPAAYTGESLKALRVNAGETGIEFFTLSVVENFTDLGDVPTDFTGHGGKTLKVNMAEDGIEFVVAGDAISQFTDLNDTPATYAAANEFLVRVNAAGDGLEFVDPADVIGGGGGATAFTDLTDVPEGYDTFGGHYLRVTDTEDGIEFVVPGEMISDFVDLADTPNDYTGFGGGFLRVTSGEDGIEFDIATLGDFDVDYTTPPTDGQFLVWEDDTDLWIPQTVSLPFLDDIDFGVAPTDGQVLTFDDGDNKWKPATPSAGGSTLPAINDQSDSYTLVLTDANDYVRIDSATAEDLTVPLNSSVAFAIGDTIGIRQVGAGQVSIVPTGGVTINTAETFKLRKQGSSATLIKVDTNEWDLTGDLELV